MARLKKFLKYLNPKTYTYTNHNTQVIETDAHAVSIICLCVLISMIGLFAVSVIYYDEYFSINMTKIIVSIVLSIVGVILTKIPIKNDKIYIIERQFTRGWISIIFLWLICYEFFVGNAKSTAIFVYIMYCIICVTLLHENPIIYSIHTLAIGGLIASAVLECFNSYTELISYIGIVLCTVVDAFYINYITRQKFDKNDAQIIDAISINRMLKENTQKLMEHEKLLQGRTAESLAYIQNIPGYQDNVILSIANLVESRDNDTGTHLKATSFYTNLITKNLMKMNVPGYEITPDYAITINKAAPMHDLGKLSIPDKILKAPRRLTTKEFEIMKQHTIEGANLINKIYKDIESEEYIKIAYNIARYHHERWDGTGYPDKKANTDIPLEARIMTVADVFDALVSKRCYKDAYSLPDAFEEIKRCAGTQFDPVIVEAFLMSKTEIEKMVVNEFKDD